MHARMQGMNTFLPPLGLFVQALHLGHIGLQLPNALGPAGVGGQKGQALRAVAGGLAHFFPQAHGRLRVVAGAGGNFQADQIGIAFVVAAEFEAEQLDRKSVV